MLLLLALLSFHGFTSVKGENWAILVGGSMGWYNYRHQSDVSHAYHTLVNSGHFSPKNIIVMMEDDIASSPENKYPGTIINHINGSNVYPGSAAIDFKGQDANKNVLLGVMNGSHPIKGKKFAPTQNDNIFFYYTDHGAVGLVGMPIGEPLYATELLGAFEYLFKNNQYKEMVVYIEACESGSMLQNLPADWRIFGTTAANAEESSYATYWDDDLGVYLGDQYSVAWMEDTDKDFASGEKETLQQQFKNILPVVNKSHPQEFGSKRIRHENIMNFQEEHQSPFRNSVTKIMKSMNVESKKNNQNSKKSKIIEVSDSRDVKLNTLKNLLTLSKSASEYLEIKQLIFKETLHREKTELVFTNLMTTFVKDRKQFGSYMNTLVVEQIDYDCLPVLYKAYIKSCGSWSDFSLKYVKVLANLCEVESVSKLEDGIESACSQEYISESSTKTAVNSSKKKSFNFGDYFCSSLN